MANANLQQIYNRLNGTANYHPYTADTFADWSLEAGDIVTVSRDGKSYSSPIHSDTVRWNGHQRVSVEARGEKERGPVSKMSARSYGGGAAVRGAGRAGGGRRKLEDEIEEIEGTELWVNRDNIAAVSGKYYVDKDGKLHIVDGSGLYMDRGNASFGLYDEGNLTGGIMVQKINGQTTTMIKGDRIEIGGKSATTVVNGKLNVSDLASEFSKLDKVTAKHLVVSNLQFSVGGGMYKSPGSLVDKVEIKAEGNNTYRLYVRHADNSVDNSSTFSRAISSWSGSWSGGTYTVTAKPQDQKHSIVIKKLNPVGEIRPISAGGRYYVSQRVDVYASYGASTSNSTNTGYKNGWVTIDASSAYQAGRDSVSHNMSCTARGLSNSASGSYAGQIGKQYISNFSYITFTMSCGGTSHNFYFTLS